LFCIEAAHGETVHGMPTPVTDWVSHSNIPNRSENAIEKLVLYSYTALTLLVGIRKYRQLDCKVSFLISSAETISIRRA
jgi:hypothetical protein